MSKKSITSSVDNTSNIDSIRFSSNISIQNNQQQDFNQSVNRALLILKRQLSTQSNQHGDHTNKILVQPLIIVGTPESVANAYSRFVSNVTYNTLSALGTTNNLVLESRWI
jgi:hypothetical protein